MPVIRNEKLAHVPDPATRLQQSYTCAQCVISSFSQKILSTPCVATSVALADIKHCLSPQLLAQVGGAPSPLETTRPARRRNDDRALAPLSLPANINEHILTCAVQLALAKSYLHAREEAIPLSRRVIRQILFGRNPHHKHAAVHLPSHHPDGMNYARVVESPDNSFKKQRNTQALISQTACYLARPFRRPCSAVVLSECTTTFLPANYVCANASGLGMVPMHVPPLSLLAKVEKPKAMDSSSRDAIWLSPLRVNCRITSLEGSKSAYSMRPSATSTAAILGGVLLASQSSCKGFCSDSTHRLHVNGGMYMMLMWRAQRRKKNEPDLTDLFSQDCEPPTQSLFQLFVYFVGCFADLLKDRREHRAAHPAKTHDFKT